MDRNKIKTIGIVVITLVLAGIAIFTALRIYNQGQDPIAPSAPGSEPFAWNCNLYTFNMNVDGVVTVTNDSSRNEPSQTAEVYINEQLIDTFEVPALSPGDSATLGTVAVPSEPFSWSVVGIRDCQNSGSLSPEVDICEALFFEIEVSPSPSVTVEPSATASPTNSPTATPTNTNQPTNMPTNSPTPTDTSVGGGPTNTPQPTATPTTSQVADNPTATPTTGRIAKANSPTPTDSGATGGAGDELPDAGFDDPIYLFAMSGLLAMLGALILAL